MSLEQIAHNIKFFRDQQEWTQMELADKLMVSRSVIAKWENYSTTPDISSLMKLSNVFHITLDQLVGNHSYRDDLLKDFKRIYSSKSKAFDEELVDLIEYIMTYPNFKEQIYRLKHLPIRKQLSLHSLFAGIIDQYEKI
ncbi:helix-turn-helix transcriptional regulator [Virgibacillus sp. NKC19-3]|uniref:helix-turn-helix domain-containing protein n=1 Tax=Virgibacillus saliphilus TaxID=2831674 RepID=UPI001C9A4BDD|nr:helix-turn-helix domain-containing protein [Virgibacillus sp. NKC19-3]MBY7142741.1 helix-turn-helix transcriptional regulator [Virgibacillus sp. NKC19-3]